jgi:hypothetical protein
MSKFKRNIDVGPSNGRAKIVRVWRLSHVYCFRLRTRHVQVVGTERWAAVGWCYYRYRTTSVRSSPPAPTGATHHLAGEGPGPKAGPRAGPSISSSFFVLMQGGVYARPISRSRGRFQILDLSFLPRRKARLAFLKA